MDGKRWARLTLWVGIVMSMYGNIQHTLIVQKHVHWGAIVFSSFWPGAVFLAIELMAKVQWPVGWAWSAARFGGLGIVALVAAIASYHHLSALLAYWGEDGTVAELGPLVPDGIMVIATTALLAIGHAQRPVEATEDLPEPDPGAELVESVSEPVSEAETAPELAEVPGPPPGPEPSSEPLSAPEILPRPEPLLVPSPNGHRPPARPRGRRGKVAKLTVAERNARAEEAYRASLATDTPLTYQEIAKQYGGGRGERWARDRQKAVRQTSQVQPALLPGLGIIRSPKTAPWGL